MAADAAAESDPSRWPTTACWRGTGTTSTRWRWRYGGRIAVSGSHDCTVRVWDLATGDARTLEEHANAVLAVAVTPDGRTAISGSSDRTVRVWDLATGEARTLEGRVMATRSMR